MSRAKIPDFIPAADLGKYTPEKEWHKTVVEAAEHHGWLVRHIRHAQDNPTGLPDLLMWRGDEYRLIELKTATGKLRKSQEKFQAECQYRDVSYHVITPVMSWADVLELLR